MVVHMVGGETFGISSLFPRAQTSRNELRPCVWTRPAPAGNGGAVGNAW